MFNQNGGFRQNNGGYGQNNGGYGQNNGNNSSKILPFVLVVGLVLAFRFGWISEIRSHLGGTVITFIIVGIVALLFMGGGSGRNKGGRGGGGVNYPNQGGGNYPNQRW